MLRAGGVGLAEAAGHAEDVDGGGALHRGALGHREEVVAVAAGETVETVVDEYQLSLEQVRSALSYAAHVAAHLPPAVRQAS